LTFRGKDLPLRHFLIKQILSTSALSVKRIISDFKEITKFRLAASVVFSSLAGFLLGVYEFNQDTWLTILMLAIGGYCLVGSSNAFNQIIEKDTDLLMDRTKNRPVPSKRMTPKTAFIIASSLTILGLVILYNINPKTAMFGAISIFLYTCVYTPLKTLTPLSVFVGAFPGAIPFMLGWVAATGDFGIEAGTLFMMQFFWQFPHFWAIGWFLFDDYKKAGIFMLPTGKQDKGTAIQIIFYTFWTVLIAIIPVIGYYKEGFLGRLYITPVSAVIITLLGVWMLYHGFKLYKKRDVKTARTLMLVSVSFLTLLQIVYVLDKFIFR
jgi:protoheme IX farnesyltransferase